MGMGRPSGLDPTRNPRDTSMGCVSLKSDIILFKLNKLIVYVYLNSFYLFISIL